MVGPASVRILTLISSIEHDPRWFYRVDAHRIPLMLRRWRGGWDSLNAGFARNRKLAVSLVLDRLPPKPLGDLKDTEVS